MNAKNQSFHQREQHDIEEAEANLFARCLLMPDYLVRREVRKMKDFDCCNDDHIKQLAKLFQVPVGLMAMRIGELMII